MRHILVDGYNLIFQFPELRKLLERDLEAARTGLLDRLSEYALREEAEIVVVFDGDDRLAGPSESRDGVRVLFSTLPEKADPVIKRMIDDVPENAAPDVITSDLEIVRYAEINGMRVISSHKFARQMGDSSWIETERKFNQTMPSDELDEWMNLFDPGNRERQSGQSEGKGMDDEQH